MPASPAMAQNLSMSSEDSHRFSGVHAGVTPEQSGQCSAAVSEIIAVVIQCHIIIHTQSFYEFGVHCSDVAAYTFEHDRYVRAYPVQIAAVRYPFVTAEKLLAPSCSMETIGHPVMMSASLPACVMIPPSIIRASAKRPLSIYILPLRIMTVLIFP